MTYFRFPPRSLAATKIAKPQRRVIDIQETSGAQEVARQFTETIASETLLKRPQSGNWSHGWYAIDATNRLSLEVDPIWLGPIAKNQSMQGEITLHNAAGIEETHTVNIHGRNTPSILVLHSTSIYQGQDSISFTPLIRDLDGPTEAKLRPGQVGAWQHGSFCVNQEGELTVFLNHNTLPPLAKGTSLAGQLSLSSVDGTQHQMTMQVLGVNDAPTIYGKIELIESKEPQKVNLTVRDPDSVTESALQPNQSGHFSHGTYYTDEHGGLKLQIERALNLPQDQWCDGSIRLRTVDGSEISHPLRIRGVNAPAQLDQHEYSIFEDQDSIHVKPQVYDADGPAEAQLKAGQVGMWERGSFVVHGDGTLTVFADRNRHEPMLEGSTQDCALKLTSVDGTRHQIQLKVISGSQLPLIQAQMALEHENSALLQSTELSLVVESDTLFPFSWSEQLAQYLPSDSSMAYSFGF